MLAPLQQSTTTPTWPIPADVAALLTILGDQAETVSAQFALLHDYQDVLDEAQAPPPTTATGSGSGTALTLSSVNGNVLIGSTVTGTGVPTTPPTTVMFQQSGTIGGAGVYTTSQATTAANAALTFTPGGGPSTWPTPQDALTLTLIVQQMTALLRTQTAMIQHYQDILNTSQTPSP